MLTLPIKLTLGLLSTGATAVGRTFLYQKYFSLEPKTDTKSNKSKIVETDNSEAKEVKEEEEEGEEKLEEKQKSESEKGT